MNVPDPSSSMTLTMPLATGLLVGIALLYQTWTRPSLQTILKSTNNQQTKLFQPSPPSSQPSHTITISKEPDNPQDWYTGTSTYDLERRALFSKHWLCISHCTQFTKPGDYHATTIAGFPIFLILGKDGTLRAFHNVCRHRAYPVVSQKDRGSSTVLGCRYHGWSYDSLGRLIKAPHFDGVVGFDRAQNGLFAVHTFTSRTGFVFVNLEAQAVGIPPEMGDGLDGFGGKSRWLGGRVVEGRVNWKMGGRVSRLMDSERIGRGGSQRRNLLSWLMHALGLSREGRGSIDVFPFTTVHVVKGTFYWYTLVCVPVSAQWTSFRLDLYGSVNVDSTDSESTLQEAIDQLQTAVDAAEEEYRPYIEDARYYPANIVMIMIKADMCSTSSSACATATQPDAEDADFPQAVLHILKAHMKFERQQGTEVYPAMRQPRRNARFEQAEQLCKKLDCGLRGEDVSW
ncbi:putative iron-sulfur cluster-binding protein [Aspergillus saccharolyticus JOP 1030-1]|uniref:ISP domain-containing protein n=1 Tax=Aspergillus saccharolyticus JOP 1030-1 TaxID=1450539 RepID=A0A319ANS6_9EURO|nr:ISP domain-containing protein [Aspergillus saccharolyticus JOP 1030-1]PYH48152.1 ISP domain-containing protein [Aspergillus saccharolyticus JOP 1030-1]